MDRTLDRPRPHRLIGSDRDPQPRPRARAVSVVVAAVMGAALSIGVAVAPVAASQSRTFVVAPSGSDGNPCTTGSPCRTIGYAIGLAPAGSRIVVEAGTYHEPVVISKRLSLIGHDATIDVSGIVASVPGPLLDNGIVGWGVLIVGPGATGSSVRGLTVQHAAAEGILAALTSHVTIADNDVHDNDTAATAPSDPLPSECAPQGEVPGDCGEAVHLLSVTRSSVMGNDVHDNVGGILLTDEVGPTAHNVIAGNVSRDNRLDCGITLPSHNPDAVADPARGGVYDNLVVNNRSERNGGAGVGMFAPFPGSASYDNRVIGNVLKDNGEAGIAIHGHAPNQNLSGNVMVGNWVSGNGIDPDSGSPAAHNGIVLFSVASPVTAVVAGNHISNEEVGIYLAGPITATGIHGNQFASTVDSHIVTAP